MFVHLQEDRRCQGDMDVTGVDPSTPWPSSKCCYFPCVYFSANDTIYEAWGLFSLFVGGGIYISSLTQGRQGRAHVPALHVQLDLGKNCCNNQKGVAQKWSGRTFLLPEQMLYYTTLVYLRPLRSVHQTWPWRLFRRRRFNKRRATCRRHCPRYKAVCVTHNLSLLWPLWWWWCFGEMCWAKLWVGSLDEEAQMLRVTV